MSRETLRKKAQKRDHAVAPSGWDPKVEEYFLDVFESAAEVRKEEEQMVLNFLKLNLPLMANWDKFWEARDSFLKKSGISEKIFDYVWKIFLKGIEDGKINLKKLLES